MESKKSNNVTYIVLISILSLLTNGVTFDESCIKYGQSVGQKGD